MDKVSEKQLTYLYAISANEYLLTSKEVKAELIKLGYKSSKDIAVSEFNRVLAHLSRVKPKPWSGWKMSEDAIAYAKQKFPDVSEREIYRWWGELKPVKVSGSRKSLAVAWVHFLHKQEKLMDVEF